MKLRSFFCYIYTFSTNPSGVKHSICYFLTASPSQSITYVQSFIPSNPVSHLTRVVVFLSFSIKIYVGNQSFRRSRLFSFSNLSGRNLLSALPANLTKIKKVQDESGLWVMPIGNYVVISGSEMETTTIARVSFFILFAAFLRSFFFHISCRLII